MTQLSFSNVAVEFGATTIFEGITFTVAAGERWGVIGRNGTGKTTLFRIITGSQQPTRGSVARTPGLRVALLEQHRDFGAAQTVWEAAAGELADLLALEKSLEAQAKALEHDANEAALERYGRDLERFEREGGYTVAPRVDAILSGLGFDPLDARTRLLRTLSGGERGRLGLARQLVRPADVILLDEPTNHLDLETTEWLEHYLTEGDGSTRTILLISHDRAFIEAVSDHILHFEGGSATPYSGGFESFVVQREERRLTQQRAFEKQRRVVAAESDYIARNIAGQNSKQAKGRRKRLERMPRLSAPIGEDEAMALAFKSGERGGDQVVVLKDVTVTVPAGGPPRSTGYDESDGSPSSNDSVDDHSDAADRVLLERFSAVVQRGDVVGLVGPNGAGKSTLLASIVGLRPPAAGETRVGASIQLQHYRQDLSQVPLDKTIYECITALRPTWERRLVQGHLGRFGFSGDEVQRRTDTLSGGERARVALAMMTLGSANLLVLDEPTNHLDVESIEALEDALGRYEGTVILVSHDRALLRALVDRTWILHERHITDFDGSFAEWETVSAERAHAAHVKAKEEEALRRVKERQKTHPKTEPPKPAAKAERGAEVGTRPGQKAAKADDRVQRRAREAASRAVQEAEARVATLEAKVGELTKALGDPDLYLQPDGQKRAEQLGRELETARAALDGALDAWAKATEAAEALA